MLREAALEKAKRQKKKKEEVLVEILVSDRWNT